MDRSKRIRYCKSFPAFTALDRDDQLSILKPFYFELNSMRMAFNYDLVNDGFRMLRVSSTYWLTRMWKLTFFQNNRKKVETRLASSHFAISTAIALKYVKLT